MRLYDLSEQYNDLIDLLESSQSVEENEEIIGSMQAMLDGIDMAFDDKVESIVKLLRSKKADYQAIKAEADRLNARAQSVAKNIAWLEGYIESQMIATGKDKIKSALFNITLGLCPPAVNITNESAIPSYYFITKPEVLTLDKRSLLETLKSGIEVPGVEIVQRKTIRIK